MSQKPIRVLVDGTRDDDITKKICVKFIFSIPANVQRIDDQLQTYDLWGTVKWWRKKGNKYVHTVKPYFGIARRKHLLSAPLTLLSEGSTGRYHFNSAHSIITQDGRVYIDNLVLENEQKYIDERLLKVISAATYSLE